MKTKSVVSLFTLLCIVSLVIEACNMPDTGTPPLVPPTALQSRVVQTHLVAPQTGGIYPVGEQISLIASVPLHLLGISRYVFLANGSPIEGLEGMCIGCYANGNLGASWAPRTSGEFYIQSQVWLTDGSTAISESNRICVMPNGWNGYQWQSSEYTGPCQLSTRIPNHATNGDVVLHAVVVPDVLVIDAYSSCTGPLPSVTFIATVDDPQDLVALVRVYLSRGDSTDPYHPHYISGWMNWITTRTGNQKEYRKTIQLTDAFLGNRNIGPGDIGWGVSPLGRDGQALGRGVAHVFGIGYRNCNQPHPGIAPPTLTPTPEVTDTATPTAVMPPTFTLKKNAFCRKGPDMTFSDVTAVTAGETVDILNVSEDGFWYFIYWKKFDAKCWVATGTGQVNGDVTGIKVLVGPSLPAPKPAEPVAPKPVLPPACTSYSDASSCTTNGCSWDKATNTCK
jgi:hypothetical protein